MKSRNYRLLTDRVTTPGFVGANAQKQGQSKIAWRTATEKFIDQCYSFQHATILKGQPVESLEGAFILRFVAICARKS